MSLSEPTATTASLPRTSSTRPTLPPSVPTSTASSDGDRCRARAGGDAAALALHRPLLGLEAIEHVRLLRRELLGACGARRGPARRSPRRRPRSPFFFSSLIVRSISARASSTYLRASCRLSFSTVRSRSRTLCSRFDDVRDALARVVLHRRRLALALRELLLLALEPLDQRRHVALALRDALLGARDDVGGKVRGAARC